MLPVIACIGGTDSSGGAGVTRDCITASALGVQALPVITLISAQTNTRCEGVSATEPAVLQRQLSCILEDQLPKAIKIGAIANDAQVHVIISALSHTLDSHPRPSVVWDPVIYSSSGFELSGLSREAIIALCPWVDVITPNIDELGLLTGLTITDSPSAETAAGHLISLGVKNVLVKGGHASWDTSARDALFSEDSQYTFSSERQHRQLRGSGCALASSIAACLAQNYALADAICVAKAVINQALQYPLAGWPHELSLFPKVLTGKNDPVEDGCRQLYFPSLSTRSLGLYPVVDSLQWLELLLSRQITIIQLRIKNKPSSLKALITEAVKLAEQHNSMLFINDHWELAMECGAYGVHLGQEDLESADLAAISNAGLRLGISTHGYAELCRVIPLRPSYLALGHIFPTSTKVMPSSPQGLERLARYVSLCDDIPTVAIGGITLSKAAQVWATGVDGIAVVSAITGAADPLRAVDQFQEVLRHAG